MTERRNVPRETLAPPDALEAALLELARVAEEQFRREKTERRLRIVEPERRRQGGLVA